MPFTCLVISDFDALASLAPEWTDLLELSSANEPTLSPLWLLPWWRTFGSLGGRKLRVVTWRDGEKLVGLCALLLRRHWYPPGIPFRRLEPLGSGEDERDEICSDYLNVVALSGAEPPIAESLAALLAADRLGSWDEMILPAMDGSSAIPRLLHRALEEQGVSAELAEVNSAPYIRLPATWGAYLEMLSSSRRYLVTRSLRDFDKWAGGTAVWTIADTMADLEKAQAILRSLHAERWAADGRPGAFESPRFRSFHDQVMRDLLARGSLELSWLSVRGEPVAALYNIVHDRKVFFYQCGRKMDVPKGVRPGIVIQTHAIKRAIARGLQEYDFLPGTQQYKMQLAPTVRPIVRLRAVKAPWLERGRVLASRTSRLLPRRIARAPLAPDLGRRALP